MKTFLTAAVTCCLILVIALQAIILRGQNHQEPIRYQAINEPVPHIETVSYTVEEGAAADLADGSEDPSWKIAATTLSSNFADSEPALPEFVPEPAPIPENPFAVAVSQPAKNDTVEPLPASLPATGPTVADAPAQPKPFDPFGSKSEPEFPDLNSDPAKDQAEEEKKVDPELAKYPIWLLIKPDGVQFLQTQEEIATHFHTIPANSFLIGCQSATFEARAVLENEEEGEPGADIRPRTFQLSCEDFKLRGSYGTKQTLSVIGDTLSYSTESQQVQLKGTDKQSLEFHSWDDSAENRMTADEIVLRLQEDGFQLSAKGASGIEINPNPKPKQQSKPQRQPSGFSPFPEAN